MLLSVVVCNETATAKKLLKAGAVVVVFLGLYLSISLTQIVRDCGGISVGLEIFPGNVLPQAKIGINPFRFCALSMRNDDRK